MRAAEDDDRFRRHLAGEPGPKPWVASSFEVVLTARRGIQPWAPRVPVGHETRLGRHGAVRIDSLLASRPWPQTEGWHLRGRLIGGRLRRWWPARMTIAVTPWSAASWQVTVAPANPRSHHWRTRRYWELAHETAWLIAAEVSAASSPTDQIMKVA
jgi:hypothetical protein